MCVCMYVCIKVGSVRFASKFVSFRFKVRSHRIAPRSGCKHDGGDDDDGGDGDDDDGDSDDDDGDGDDDNGDDGDGVPSHDPSFFCTDV